MTSVKADCEKISSNLTHIFGSLNIDLNVSYRDDIDGLKPGLVFIKPMTDRPIPKAELLEKLTKAASDWKVNAASSKNPSEIASAKGKLAWIESFKQFIFENETDFAPWTPDYKAAIISKETATKEPFKQLLKNAGAITAEKVNSEESITDIKESFGKLTPINWDLKTQNMSGVVKALNNIARMEGNENIHFQLEKGTNRVIYFSDISKEHPDKNLSKDQMNQKVSAMIEHIVSIDKSLKSGSRVLNEQGKQVASKMDAFKDERYYVSFEKETGFEPDYLVDLVENAQIAIAAERYLNFKNVGVQNEKPFEQQGAIKVTKSEDGKDAYSYINRNLTSQEVSWWHYHNTGVGSYNEMAPIPNLTTQDNRRTNVVSNQKEEDLAATLNLMRGALPAELSDDPVVVTPLAAPVKKAPSTHRARQHH